MSEELDLYKLKPYDILQSNDIVKKIIIIIKTIGSTSRYPYMNISQRNCEVLTITKGKLKLIETVIYDDLWIKVN